MKNTDFLKMNIIVNKGIYDNINIFENTLEAFEEAIKKDYSLHFSVSLTLDQVPVIYHDEDLADIINLKDKISTVTYDELNYFSPYKIPSLESALNFINGRVPIIINPRDLLRQFFLQKEIVSLLDNYQGSFAIVSHDASAIRWFNKFRPNYIVGEVITKKRGFRRNSIKNLFAHFTIMTDFKSLNIKYYDILKIKQLKEESIILCYLIDSKEKYDIFRNAGDNIFVDNVADLELEENPIKPS